MYDNIFIQECPECRGYSLECPACNGKGTIPTDQGEMLLEFLREFGQPPKHFHSEYELKHMVYGGKL